MVTVISRFRVRNGLEEEVRRAFLNRPRLVEKTPGFRGLEVLTDSQDPAVFLLLTRWADEASFQTWHRSEAHHQSHGLIPQGLKLDAAYTSLTVGNRIEDPAGIQTLSDALDGQTVGLSRWLAESDGVCALLLSPDGVIRARNSAADRMFAPDPAANSGPSIWDYLVCTDVEPLRQRLSESAGQDDDYLLLNLSDAQHKAVTLDAGLIRCGGSTLLLGTQERRHDSQFQDEIVKLTNDLSVMIREADRKTRELEEAKKTVERLARTDALTGLANRRTLHEALQLEIARAGRLNASLSVIIADLDHFKSINDRYGHIHGDSVLVHAAAVFATQSRTYDLAARYGGEEFILLLPGTPTREAAAIAERIRKEVEGLQVAECPARITLSLGVATWRTGEAPEPFVSRADAALYHAKDAGRNRVEVAAEVTV